MPSPIPPRASAHASRTISEYTEPEPDDAWYPRMPKSALRIRDTREDVYTQGNRRIVVHHEPPPKPKHRIHWLLWVGLILIIMLVGWTAITIIGNWWTNTSNYWAYGMPRTFQTDANVGHNDSQAHPSHFIAINLNAHIEVIEFPGGDPSHAKIYIGPTLFGPGANLTPVTLTFRDVNNDGKPDMLIHVQDQTFIFLNKNGEFVPAAS